MAGGSLLFKYLSSPNVAYSSLHSQPILTSYLTATGSRSRRLILITPQNVSSLHNNSREYNNCWLRKRIVLQLSRMSPPIVESTCIIIGCTTQTLASFLTLYLVITCVLTITVYTYFQKPMFWKK